MESYLYNYNFRADVDVAEMKKSDSKDKYVHSRCEWKTVFLTLESEQIWSKNISSHDLSEDLSEEFLSNDQK